MNIEEYQQQAWKTALETAKNPAYMVSNLTSEAGEVAGKYAKWIRDGVLDEEGLQKEMCIVTGLELVRYSLQKP